MGSRNLATIRTDIGKAQVIGQYHDEVRLLRLRRQDRRSRCGAKPRQERPAIECHRDTIYRTPTSVFLRDGEKLVPIHNEHRSIGRHDRAVDRTPHVGFEQELHLPAGLHHHDVTVFVAEIDLAVNHHRAAPDGGEHVVLPELLAGFGINCVEEAAEICIVKNAVVQRTGGNGTANGIVPQLPCFGDVAALGCIDSVEVCVTLSVFRVLSIGDVNAVALNDRS